MSTTKKRSSVQLLNIFLDIITVGAVYLLAQFIAAVALYAGGIEETSDLASNPGAVVAAYLVSGVVMGLALYLIIRGYALKKAFLYLRRPTLSDAGVTVLGFVVYLIATVTAGLVLRLVPGVDADQKQDLGLDTASNALLPLVFVVLVVLPPLVEEFMFRGFLYQRLKSYRLSRMVSAVVVSVLFGMVHGQVNVAVDTFILSMIMIYALERQKNIWVAVMIHALKNTLAFLALFIFKWV